MSRGITMTKHLICPSCGARRDVSDNVKMKICVPCVEEMIKDEDYSDDYTGGISDD
jgi:hypothetical protein